MLAVRHGYGAANPSRRRPDLGEPFVEYFAASIRPAMDGCWDEHREFALLFGALQYGALLASRDQGRLDQDSFALALDYLDSLLVHETPFLYLQRP